jgi:hypothetical protein
MRPCTGMYLKLIHGNSMPVLLQEKAQIDTRLKREKLPLRTARTQATQAEISRQAPLRAVNFSLFKRVSI